MQHCAKTHCIHWPLCLVQKHVILEPLQSYCCLDVINKHKRSHSLFHFQYGFSTRGQQSEMIPLKWSMTYFFPFDIGKVPLMHVSCPLDCSFVSLIIKPWPSEKKLKHRAISWYSPSFWACFLIFVQYKQSGEHADKVTMVASILTQLISLACRKTITYPEIALWVLVEHGVKCVILVTWHGRWKWACHPGSQTLNDNDSKAQRCMWWAEHIFTRWVVFWIG